MAVVEIVHLRLDRQDPTGPRLAVAFAASRKARNADEYPSPLDAQRTERELRALVLDNVRVANRVRTMMGFQELSAVLPTDEVLQRRPERSEPSGP